jgi:hypothetical protein
MRIGKETKVRLNADLNKSFFEVIAIASTVMETGVVHRSIDAELKSLLCRVSYHINRSKFPSV